MSPELERLIGKAVVDVDFRKKLLDNPDEAVKEAGIVLTDDELEKVRKVAQERAQDVAGTNKVLDAAKGGQW
ncbi:MAG: Franean1_4349 family RiPP [Oscillochloris sp.]|nr:Franean1_4349 family RiPP [Oscillochloris sp.]